MSVLARRFGCGLAAALILATTPPAVTAHADDNSPVTDDSVLDAVDSVLSNSPPTSTPSVHPPAPPQPAPTAVVSLPG